MSDNSTRIYLEDNFCYQLGYTSVLRKNGAIYGIRATKDNTQVGELVELSGSGSVPIATDDTPGIVKPDGSTITVGEDGTITAALDDVLEECRKMQEDTIKEVEDLVSSINFTLEPIE